MDRTDVYKLIDAEREYQIGKWGKDIDTGAYDFMKYVAEYTKFGCAYAKMKNKDSTLECLRKISAICVAAMEKFETKPRQ